jgi:hypothetical protein
MGADRGEMKAYPEKQEEISEETESKLEHQEVPKEEVAVETVTALKKQYGNQHLDVEPKKRTQDNGGTWKEVAAARRGMTLHAIPAPRKGHDHQGQGCKRNLERMDIREEMSGETRRHQWHKEQRLQGAATSWK